MIEIDDISNTPSTNDDVNGDVEEICNKDADYNISTLVNQCNLSNLCRV